MGEKGSLKNLYKNFRLFLSNLKKQKLLKQNVKVKNKNISKKIKEKSKFSFFILLTSVIGFFISFFAPIKKSKKTEIKKIETKKDIEKLKVIAEEYEQKVDNINETNKLKECKSNIIAINKVIENSVLVVDNKIINKLKMTERKIDTKIDSIKKEVSENVKKESKEIIKDNNFIKNSITKEVNIVIQENNDFDLKKEINKLEDKLKKQKIKKEDLDYVNKILNENDLYEVRELKKKIELFLFSANINCTDNLVVNIDNKSKNNIPNNIKNSKIDLLENEKETLKQIKERINLDNKKEKFEKEKPKLETKKEKEKSKNMPIIDTSFKEDIIRSISIINGQIKINEKMVLETRKLRKNHFSFFNRIKYMISNTLRMCAGLSPIFFFKRKDIGIFTSAVLLNNSIRGMRRTISTKKSNINYYDGYIINELIKTTNDIEFETKNIINNSLEQVNLFRNELYLMYGNYLYANDEIKNMLYEIDEIENNILSKKQELEKQTNSAKRFIKTINKEYF